MAAEKSLAIEGAMELMILRRQWQQLQLLLGGDVAFYMNVHCRESSVTKKAVWQRRRVAAAKPDEGRSAAAATRV